MVARALGAAMAWGVLLAWWYDAPLLHGLLVGLWAWGPGIVLSARWRDTRAEDTPIERLYL
jgi:hypothetical protein